MRASWKSIERLRSPGPRSGLIARGAETRAPYVLTTPVGEAAVHTCRGVGYKAWNEDGAALFADRQGRFYLAVFDQAGGMGSVAGQPGAASGLAAAAFHRRMRSVAKDGPEPARIGQGLFEAVEDAHRAVLARDRQEATTSIAGVVDGERAILLNVGDSGALRIDRAGAVAELTRAHRLPPPLPQNVITQAIGQWEQEPRPDLYEWSLEPGDHLLFGSDGLFEAGLGHPELAALTLGAAAVRDAVVALREAAYERMGDRRGKRDNLSLIVLRLTGARAGA